MTQRQGLDFLADEMTRRTGKQWNGYHYIKSGLGRFTAISFRNDENLDALAKYKIKEAVAEVAGWNIDNLRMRIHSKNKMIMLYEFGSVDKIQETPTGFTWAWAKPNIQSNF